MSDISHSLQDVGVGTITLKNYKKIRQGRVLVIALPTVEAMMTGVSRFGITRDGEVTAVYRDETRETVRLTEKQLLGIKNVVAMTSLVQEMARGGKS